MLLKCVGRIIPMISGNLFWTPLSNCTTSTKTHRCLRTKYKYFSTSMVRLCKIWPPIVPLSTQCSCFKTNTLTWTWEERWLKHLSISSAIYPTQSISFTSPLIWSRSVYRGPYNETSIKSCIALKLLPTAVHVVSPLSGRISPLILDVDMPSMTNAWFQRIQLSVWPA